MPELLARTALAIDDCKSHLKTTKAFGSPIESYLTQYVLIVLYSDIQQELYKIVGEMAGKNSNKLVEQFILSSLERNLRNIRKDNLADFMNMFGASVKTKFNSKLSEKDVTIYNNAVFYRHAVAHSLGVEITFSELGNTLRAARKMLFAFKSSLT